MSKGRGSKRYSTRIASLGDASAISGLLHASYSTLLQSHYSPEILSIALPLITKANPELLASGNYYVAIAGDDRIVGCGGWSLQRPGTGETEDGIGHIRHFATHPEWAGMGIGRALMTQCLEAAEGGDVKTLECYSTLNASPFYRSCGFIRARTMEIELAEDTGFPALHMWRRVP